MRTVAKTRPNIMAYAIEDHILPPLRASGSSPNTVVAVVMMMGRNRDLADSTIAFMRFS